MKPKDETDVDLDIIITSWADLTNWNQLRNMDSPWEIWKAWRVAVRELWMDLIKAVKGFPTMHDHARRKGYDFDKLLRKEARKAAEQVWLGRRMTELSIAPSKSDLTGKEGEVVAVEIPLDARVSKYYRIQPHITNSTIDQVLAPRLIIKTDDGKTVNLSSGNFYLRFTDSSPMSEAKLRRTIRRLIREESLRNRR